MKQDLEQRVADLEKELDGWKVIAQWLTEAHASTAEILVHGHDCPDPLHELVRHKALLRLINPIFNEPGKVPFYRYAAAIRQIGSNPEATRARLTRAAGDLSGLINEIRRRRERQSPVQSVTIQ